jgi:hypothetical protein
MGSDNGRVLTRRTNCLQQACGCQYSPSVETLEYDYTQDGTTSMGKQQPLPRIRQRGEYYVDTFNAESWSCALGTNEEVSVESVEFILNVCQVGMLVVL